MQCPICNHSETHVLDSRDVDEGISVRRRRECEKCHFRFSTMEEMEILNLRVVKNDGTDEAYDKEKLSSGLKKALEKRPITSEKFKLIINRIERDIQLKASDEKITSGAIGQIVVKHLKRCDKVAYVRFISVYQNYNTLKQFQDVLRELKPKTKQKS